MFAIATACDWETLTLTPIMEATLARASGSNWSRSIFQNCGSPTLTRFLNVSIDSFCQGVSESNASFSLVMKQTAPFGFPPGLPDCPGLNGGFRLARLLGDTIGTLSDFRTLKRLDGTPCLRRRQ